MIKSILNELRGINLIDIGSSGQLDPKWQPLQRYLNVIGFDPNEEECKRMEALPHAFRSVKYLPYAISGEQTESILYKTKSIYCYSLLKPNTEWLRRFAFSDLFELTGQEVIQTRSLSSIYEMLNLDVDVIKTDTQGLELPILKNGGKALEDAFMVETETGFVENYIGETTYSQIDEFMRANKFLLFDLNTSHRIARNNVLQSPSTGAEQLMWCEAVWLKDYIAIARSNGLTASNFGKEKVLKALALCALQGCIDYGLEIAKLAFDLGVITSQEIAALERRDTWVLETSPLHSGNSRSAFGTIVNYGLRLLPKRLRSEVKRQAELTLKQKHLFKSLM